MKKPTQDIELIEYAYLCPLCCYMSEIPCFVKGICPECGCDKPDILYMRKPHLNNQETPGSNLRGGELGNDVSSIPVASKGSLDSKQEDKPLSGASNLNNTQEVKMEIKQCARCHDMKNISRDSIICEGCEEDIKKIPLEANK